MSKNITTKILISVYTHAWKEKGVEVKKER